MKSFCKGAVNKVCLWLSVGSVVLLLFSCGNTAGRVVDLTGVADGEVVLPSDSLFSSVRFIPLETRYDCMIGGGTVFAVNDGNVLVWAGNSIFRFGMDGRFLNRVGRFGKGHGEHGNIISANYDRKEKVVYIGTGGNLITKYSIEGNYIGRMKVPESLGSLNSMKFNADMGLVCEMRDYKKHGLDVTLVCLSRKGEILRKYRAYSDREAVKVSMHRTGMLKNISSGVLFMLPYSDKVLMLNSDGTADSLSLYRGDRKPSRQEFEDWDNSNSLYRSRYLIDNIAPTDGRLYLLMTTDNRQREVVVDIRRRRIVYNRSYGYSDENAHIQLSGFESACFWPWIAVSANSVADLLPIERFRGKDLDRLRELSSNDFPLDAESNPVLVIAEDK